MAVLSMKTSDDSIQDRIYCIDKKCFQLSVCLKQIEQKKQELNFIAADSNRYGAKTQEIKENASIELLKHQKEQEKLIQFLNGDVSKL
jgi:hypothetical protein